MKNIMKLVAVIFVVGILSNSLFAQEAQTVKNVKKTQLQQANWVDANGDGICDNGTGTAQGTQNKNKKMNKGANKGTGSGEALGNGRGDGSGQRPQDGTGFGKKSGGGTGNCDGTQASRKGSGRRGGK